LLESRFPGITQLPQQQKQALSHVALLLSATNETISFTRHRKTVIEVTSAVRNLADNLLQELLWMVHKIPFLLEFGLRVVADGSQNSIPPLELIAKKRETLFAVDPITKEHIESIPEFKGLIDFLKSQNYVVLKLLLCRL
jgi:hypothetical protein